MLPVAEGKKVLKSTEILPLSKGIQNFYGSECFQVMIDSVADLEEIVKVISEAYRRQKSKKVVE